MKTPECIQLCPDCPLVPEAVTVGLTDVAMLTEEEMRDYKYGKWAPDSGRVADQRLSETRRVTFTVIKSTNPSIDVGDEATELIRTYDLTNSQVMEGFAACEGPTRVGPIARALGKTAACSGIPGTW